MTEQEAKMIIKEETLKRFNWFDDHQLRENEVGIKVNGEQWVVYVTDERASIVEASVTKFNTKEDALVNFIKRLRTEKILFE